MTVILLTFNEGFFRLNLICRFRLIECRVDRQTVRQKERKKGRERKKEKEKEKESNFQVLESSAKGL